MRYRITNSKEKKLGQVFTPPLLAVRLAKSFSGKSKSWLELGIGSGRIANACIEYRKPKQYVGVDVDLSILDSFTEHPCIKLVHANVLETSLLNKSIGKQKFDCVVGNPPYGLSKITLQARKRLWELCPGITQTSMWGQLDLFFVLESLSKLKRPGQAAFIVSSTLIEDPKLLVFRQQLLSEASEVQSYELPLSTFDGKAEVRSFLLIARFTSINKNKCKVVVGKIDGEQFDIVDAQMISIPEGIVCLSFTHHRFLDFDASMRRKQGCVSLNELGVKITRGSKSKFEFNNLGITHFHLSDFPKNSNRIHLLNYSDDRFKLAQAGDILIPRVGSRCLKKQAIITEGSIPFTDSIYRLQLPKNSRNRVLKWFGSPEGLFWRESAAKGSCAKHLTVQSLLNMPVPIYK